MLFGWVSAKWWRKHVQTLNFQLAKSDPLPGTANFVSTKQTMIFIYPVEHFLLITFQRKCRISHLPPNNHCTVWVHLLHFQSVIIDKFWCIQGIFDPKVLIRIFDPEVLIQIFDPEILIRIFAQHSTYSYIYIIIGEWYYAVIIVLRYISKKLTAVIIYIFNIIINNYYYF